ncbi:MAG: Holliday junction resolvase RuvX [Eubacterium sp.]|nr:Holliday junction resolvase RuvX [Eubacterium sp.]
MRYMGLDFGDKTVGVALSDERGLIAQPYETIERERANKLRRTYARIEEIIVSEGVTEIVLGFPKNMNNTEGERVKLTEEFKENLERRTRLPIHLVDERLTTVAADRVLSDMDVAKKDRKTYIDKVAAALILETFLGTLSNSANSED